MSDRKASHYSIEPATHRAGWTVWEHGTFNGREYLGVADVCATRAEAESALRRRTVSLLERVGPDTALLESTMATDVFEDLAYLGGLAAGEPELNGDLAAIRRTLELLRDYYAAAKPSTHQTSRELRRLLTKEAG